MIGQAGKRLHADDIGHALMYHLHHLPAQKPPLAVLIAYGQERLGIFRYLVHRQRRGKSPAAPECIDRRTPDCLHHVGARLSHQIHLPALAKVPVLIAQLIEAHRDEVQQIRHDRLRALRLEQLYEIVVGKRHILHQYLARDADPRLLHALVQLQRVEVLDYRAAYLSESIAPVTARKCLYDDIAPLFMERIGRAPDLLIRSGAVQAFHHQIAADYGSQSIVEHLRIELEALIFLKLTEIEGNDGDLRQSRLVQRSPDKSHIVARPAAPSGLAHQQRDLIYIILARQYALHQLPDGQYGRVAGVVIYIFQPDIYRLPAGIFQHLDMIAVLSEYRLQQIEMYRAHVRAQQRITFVIHLLGKCRMRIVHALRLCLDAVGGSHIDRRYQAAHADPRRAEIVDLVDLQDGIELT